MASDSRGIKFPKILIILKNFALTVDRTQDLQIFSLTLSQLSYQGMLFIPFRFFIKQTCIKNQSTVISFYVIKYFKNLIIYLMSKNAIKVLRSCERGISSFSILLFLTVINREPLDSSYCHSKQRDNGCRIIMNNFKN